jgi:aldehyde:ferredoxin oxidoreductase
MEEDKSKRYLFIDLTREIYLEKEIHNSTVINFPSGTALATYLLYSNLPPGTDPLSPESVVVLTLGMLAGMPYPGATRMGIAVKSPITGLWSGGTMGGRFAWALSQTGWDAFVIQGRASELSYLLLDEGRVFFRSAKEIEGCSPYESRKRLKETWGEGAAVLSIGAAGESQIRFATLEGESNEYNQRGGIGAVFGAKNLKAVVVRPYESLKIGKTDKFLEAVLPLIKTIAENESDTAARMKSLNVLKELNDANALPTRNFQSTEFSDEWFDSLEELETRKRSCPGCPVACIDFVLYHSDSEKMEDPVKMPLHPRSLWALGPLLNVMSVDESLAAIRECLDYGLDPVSLGIVAAWAAECREKNIDLGINADFEPEFENGSWLTHLPQRITENPDIRELLGQGVMGAAKRIDPASEAFAMHFWGQELPFIDPRSGFWPISFLGPAVWIEPNACGLSSEFWLEEDWAHKMIQLENRWALMESIGICTGVGMARDDFCESLPLFYQLITGNSVSRDLVNSWGEKCVNLVQAFNWREGWRPEKLGLPKRFFEEQLTTPEKTYPALDAGMWRERMEHYFLLRGWSREGDPGDMEM